jgi:alpha-D-ribose 1-methylphosphonate 5-triphosphate synthase subunit PhnH
MNSTAADRDHRIFRTILKSISRPGSVCQLPHISAGDRYCQLADMLGCLVDNEVSFSVINDDNGAIRDNVSRHTGSRLAAIEEADFVIVGSGSSNGQLSGMKRGNLEYPDGGATVVYLVDEISSDGGRFRLSGPGINGSNCPSYAGLADSELTMLRDANAEFPLGVDALFMDRSGRISSIPRSTCIGEN